MEVLEEFGDIGTGPDVRVSIYLLPSRLKSSPPKSSVGVLDWPGICFMSRQGAVLLARGELLKPWFWSTGES